MEIVIAIALVLALAWFVTVPLRRGSPVDAVDGGDVAPAEDPRIAALEARKEALYRQIRDAEFDRAQGKLSEADWRRHDAELRREAIAVLKEIDRARAGSG